MKFIKLSSLLAFPIFIFFSCKKPKVDEPKPEALDTTINYVGIKTIWDKHIESIKDSTSNTYYIVFDTTKYYYENKKAEFELSITTKGQLTFFKSNKFNTTETNSFEVSDGLGNGTKYSVIPIISYAKSNFEYTFESYSIDTINTENNKRINVVGINDNYNGGSPTFSTWFSPVYQDQYSNTLDDITLYFVTNDKTQLIIDNKIVNQQPRNDLISYFINIKNIPRDEEARKLFFQQKNYNEISCEFAIVGIFDITSQKFRHESTEAYADFISYDSFLNTINLDIHFKSPYNYTSNTTYGGSIIGKIELRNYSIRNRSY